MKRKMLFFERFMYVDGSTPINCMMTAQIRGPLHEADLRTALEKVQKRHQLLQARVIEEDGEPYFLFGEGTPEIPVRIVERHTDDDWEATTIAEWRVPFDAKTGPLVRVVWIRSENAQEVTVIAHHCICDGGSLITLLNEILRVADQPDMELPPYTSYSSFEELVPKEALTDPKAIRRVTRKVALFKLFLHVMGRKAVTLAGDAPYALYWTAGAEQLAVFNERCKVEETTLYAALCVAFLQAFRDVQGKKAHDKIVCPVNIRRFLPAIGNDMMFAFAPTVELSLGRQNGGDFWTLARRMKQSIGDEIKAMNVYEDLMVGDRMRSMVPKIVNFLRSSRGGHDVAFSNVGRLRVQTTYKTFSLAGITGTSVAVPWRNTNTLLMTSFLRELNLNFISNERFLPRRDALAIRERALQRLQDAMELPVATAAVEG